MQKKSADLQLLSLRLTSSLLISLHSVTDFQHPAHNATDSQEKKALLEGDSVKIVGRRDVSLLILRFSREM